MGLSTFVSAVVLRPSAADLDILESKRHSGSLDEVALLVLGLYGHDV